MRLLLIATATMLTFSSFVCAEDSILKTAAANGSFNTLVSLVVAADLDDALDNKGSLTVFAPTDEAFAKLPKELLEKLRKPSSRDQLAGILKYHVLPTEVSIPSKRPSHPMTSAKTLLGKPVKFERKGKSVRINDADVVIRNIKCSNGLIHVIDTVLIPPAEDQTIVGVAKKAGDFSTLLAAVEAAGLGDALAGEGPLTVFAPTDKAFKSLPKGTVESLLKPENKSKLAEILKYHVVSGKVSAIDAIKAGSAKTLANQKLQFAVRNGRISVNQANVTANDIETSNGIIHVIDRVLLPGTDSSRKVSDDNSTSNHNSTSNQTNKSKGEVTITSDWDSPVEKDGVKAERLIIRCGGAGRVRLTNVDAKEIITTIGGGGSVFLEGSTTVHQVNVSGGASLKAAGLKTDKTQVHVNGGGNAAVNASKKLIASANGGATLKYVETKADIEKKINRYAKFEPITANSNSKHH